MSVLYLLIATVAACSLYLPTVLCSKCICVSVTTRLQSEAVPPDGAVVVAEVKPPHCFPYTGKMAASPEGNIWAQIVYNGQNAWINSASTYLRDCNDTTFRCVCTLSTTAARSCRESSCLPVAGLDAHVCFPYNQVSPDGLWAHIRLNTGLAWVKVADTGFHFICDIPTTTTTPSVSLQPPGCPQIVTRKEWGARLADQFPGTMPATPKYIFLHHGATESCSNTPECIRTLQSYQNYHMDGHGWGDVGYNFLVGEDGLVYEGRGWTEIGAHTYGYNTVGIAFCVIGNFMKRPPNDAALAAVRAMIACAEKNAKVIPAFTLLGHRNVGTTECPGDEFYRLITTWPHFNGTRT